MKTGIIKRKTIAQPEGKKKQTRRVVTHERVTTLGVICKACGKTIDDQELLDEARNMRWECPFCGAKHISLNDERDKAITIESGADEDNTLDDEGEDNCKIGHMDPDKLRRIQEEFAKKTSL